MAGVALRLALMSVAVTVVWVMGKKNGPEQVHLSPVAGTDNRKMLVFWMTDEPTASSVVWLGTDPDRLWRKFFSREEQLRYRMNSYRSPYTHEVVLEGLSAEPKTYYYRCGDEEGGWSEVFSFEWHSSHPDADVRVLTFGDQDMQRPSRQVIDAAVERNFDFHYFLHLGDITYADGKGRKWDEYGFYMEPLLAKLPAVYALGNHENEKKRQDISYAAYLYRWRHGERSEQEDGGWFSVNMGPIHLVVLSSEHHNRNKWSTCKDCTEKQLAFLESDLQDATQPHKRAVRPWIIVALHRPPMQSSRTGLDRAFSDALEELFERYSVNIVLAGHCHDYQRSHPMFRRKEVKNFGNGSLAAPYIMPIYKEEKPRTQGQIYMVVGTGGAESDGPCPTQEWHVSEPLWLHGMGIIQANRERLLWRFVNKEGETLDSFKVCSTWGCGKPPDVSKWQVPGWNGAHLPSPPSPKVWWTKPPVASPLPPRPGLPPSQTSSLPPRKVWQWQKPAGGPAELPVKMPWPVNITTLRSTQQKKVWWTKPSGTAATDGISHEQPRKNQSGIAATAPSSGPKWQWQWQGPAGSPASQPPSSPEAGRPLLRQSQDKTVAQLLPQHKTGWALERPAPLPSSGSPPRNDPKAFKWLQPMSVGMKELAGTSTNGLANRTAAGEYVVEADRAQSEEQGFRSVAAPAGHGPEAAAEKDPADKSSAPTAAFYIAAAALGGALILLLGAVLLRKGHPTGPSDAPATEMTS